MNTLTRRHTLAIAISTALASLSSQAYAQGPTTFKPIKEGADYRVLKSRVAGAADTKKIEVIEFFWYGCPHCNSLDPSLIEWLKKAPADVSFKRVHINFDAEGAPVKRTDTHQRLFIALETLGIIDKMTPKVFTAIHGDKKSLNSRDAVMEWAAGAGIDLPKFTAVYDDAFSMSRKMKSAAQLQDNYKVDSVPYFGIDGQYITSPSIAGGSLDNFYATLNAVIDKARQERTPVKTAEAAKKPEVKKVVKKPEAKP